MYVSLCGLFVFVVVFLSRGSGVLLVMVFLKLCSVSPSVPMVFCGCGVWCKSGICATECAWLHARHVECSRGLSPFLLSFVQLEPALGVVFPDGCSQHRRLCVRVERPCFHRRVKVFEVVKLLHLAPNSGSRCEFGLCFAFVLEGLLCGMCELCHKEECREYEYVVNSDGEV